MLGSFARKLRIFGFDTSYFQRGSDDELLRLAERDGRAIVTSDRTLGTMARARGLKAFILEGRSDRERILSLVEQARSSGFSLLPGEPLCAVCNGELSALKRKEVKGLLSPKLLARHRAYYVCRDCGKVYWHGRHWQRLRRLESLMPGAKRI